MMGDDHSRSKNLKDLLDEDQEPFHLSQYIANKRSKILPLVPHRQKKIKQIQKQPISQNASFPANLCKSACFFSTSFPAVDSPNRKSPLMLLSPYNKDNNTNTLFLNVPSKTAALLLESALRIQSQRSSVTSSAGRKNKSARFGLLGSVFRRITHRNRTRNPEIRSPSVDVVRWADSVKHDDEGSTTRQVLVEEQTRRLSSSFWSEGNKSSLEVGSCCSSSSSSSNSSNIYSCCSHSSSRDDSDHEDDDQHQVAFVNGHLERGETCNDIGEFRFCQSPFRFAIHTSPSPDRRPASGVSSPASSPSTFEYQGKSNFEKVKFQGEEEPAAAAGRVGEKDKEQNSPVCVLDPPFEDDEVEVYPHGNNDNREFNLHCSYEFVQKAKQSLLQKLSKFERLAELEPEELDYEEELECTSLSSSHVEIKDEDDIGDIDSIEKGFDISTEIQQLVTKVPGMKRLISDLIAEEHMMTINNNIRDDDSGPEVVVNRRAYKRIIESCRVGRGTNIIHDPINTIAGMVEFDFKVEKHCNEWKKAKEDISGQARELEILIFSVLVEELFDELILSGG